MVYDGAERDGDYGADKWMQKISNRPFGRRKKKNTNDKKKHFIAIEKTDF